MRWVMYWWGGVDGGKQLCSPFLSLKACLSFLPRCSPFYFPKSGILEAQRPITGRSVHFYDGWCPCTGRPLATPGFAVLDGWLRECDIEDLSPVDGLSGRSKRRYWIGASNINFQYLGGEILDGKVCTLTAMLTTAGPSLDFYFPRPCYYNLRAYDRSLWPSVDMYTPSVF